MITDLAVPFLDTHAGQLRLRLGGPPRDALGTLRVPTPGGILELRLLGASHQVLLDSPHGSCSEVVACAPGADEPLPAELTATMDRLDYRFEAEVRELAAAELTARVRRLTAELAEHPAALLGVFPGSADAVTAVVAEVEPDSVAWRTWHSYPQTRQIAITRTKVRTPA